MKKKLSLISITFYFSLSMIYTSYAQKTTLYLAPGATTPSGIKVSNPTARVASVVPNVCDASDIRIFPSSLPQSEMHLSINKQNPQNLLLSAQTLPVTNSYQGAYWSFDGGMTWSGSDVLPNGVSGRGDPSTAFDAAGNGFISTMTRPTSSTNINDEPNGYSLLKSANGGSAWKTFDRVANNIFGFDKEMIAADNLPSSPYANNIYSAWSELPANSSDNKVKFHRSNDGGSTFSSPITLKTGWGQGTNVQTGINGEVYVCWADYTNGQYPAQGLGFARSIDGGTTFSATTIPFNYVGIRKSGGPDDNFHGIRVNDFPSMAVDKSTGPQKGRIYVVYAAQENGNGKAIIQFRYSDDKGNVWSAPLTVSIPNGTQNWFPWLAVDDVTGYVYVVYYSFDSASGFSTNTYMAFSVDGGATFTNQKVSDVSHITSGISNFGGGYCGDYIGITAHNNKIYPAWTDNRSGQWQVYVSPVINSSSSSISGPSLVCSTGQYSIPNLLSGSTVTWSSSNTSALTIDQNGKATRVGSFNGVVNINASINGSCGNFTLPAQTITVGSPLPGPVSGYFDYTFGKVSAETSGSPYATTYNWYINNVLARSGTYTSMPPSPTGKKGCGYYAVTVSVEAINPCGTSQRAYTTFYPPVCGGSSLLTVYPNPANSNITVVKQENKMTSDSTSLNLITNDLLETSTNTSIQDEITLFDQYNQLMWHGKLINGKISFSTSKFRDGFYYLKVDDGKNQVVKQVIIQH